MQSAATTGKPADWSVRSRSLGRSAVFGSLFVSVHEATGKRQTFPSVAVSTLLKDCTYAQVSYLFDKNLHYIRIYVVRIAWLVISSLCQSTDPTDYSLTKGTSKKERTRLASSRCLLVTGSSLPSLCTPLSLIPPHLTLARYPLFSRLFSASPFLSFSPFPCYKKNGYQASLSVQLVFCFLLFFFFFFITFLARVHCHVVRERNRNCSRWVYEFVEWKQSIMCFYFCWSSVGTTQCCIWSEKWSCFKQEKATK